MPGRKPLGPRLAQHLDGSSGAKERLEVILETIAGRLPVPQACERLGIGVAMFHRLRTEVLQAGLARLEPRPLGRPPRPTSVEAEQIDRLNHEVQDLHLELKTTRVKLEIAQTLPHLLGAAAARESRAATAVKKTTQPAQPLTPPLDKIKLTELTRPPVRSRGVVHRVALSTEPQTRPSSIVVQSAKPSLGKACYPSPGGPFIYL